VPFSFGDVSFLLYGLSLHIQLHLDQCLAGSTTSALSSYRAGSAPALAREVDGTRWRRRRWSVVVLVYSQDEVIWCFRFRVQRVGEEEGDVLAEGDVCEEW
jgi:hypothetical protein